jgi:hypothetical protein
MCSPEHAAFAQGNAASLFSARQREAAEATTKIDRKQRHQRKILICLTFTADSLCGDQFYGCVSEILTESLRRQVLKFNILTNNGGLKKLLRELSGQHTARDEKSSPAHRAEAPAHRAETYSEKEGIVDLAPEIHEPERHERVFPSGTIEILIAGTNIPDKVCIPSFHV